MFHSNLSQEIICYCIQMEYLWEFNLMNNPYQIKESSSTIIEILRAEYCIDPTFSGSSWWSSCLLMVNYGKLLVAGYKVSNSCKVQALSDMSQNLCNLHHKANWAKSNGIHNGFKSYAQWGIITQKELVGHNALISSSCWFIHYVPVGKLLFNESTNRIFFVMLIILL